MIDTLSALVKNLTTRRLSRTQVIRWSAPVPAFGALHLSTVATLGLNPSNREFVDEAGNELEGDERRFHTLRSLGLKRWADVLPHHLTLIGDSCDSYFEKNPYDGWFRKLDHVIGDAASYYSEHSQRACHLDLIPYATACKWTSLPPSERGELLELAGDALGRLVANSAVKVLILNGNAVVSHFESICDTRLTKRAMSTWTLPRQGSDGVVGHSYTGAVNSIAGIALPRKILVLGYNHNIQSSFGVTRAVMDSIRSWIGAMVQAERS